MKKIKIVLQPASKGGSDKYYMFMIKYALNLENNDLEFEIEAGADNYKCARSKEFYEVVEGKDYDILILDCYHYGGEKWGSEWRKHLVAAGDRPVLLFVSESDYVYSGLDTDTYQFKKNSKVKKFLSSINSRGRVEIMPLYSGLDFESMIKKIKKISDQIKGQTSLLD